MIWVIVSFWSCFCFSIFGCKEYNQSGFSVDHLVMSMCSVTGNLNLIPPPGFRSKQVYTYSSWGEFKLLTASLPLVFKPAKRNYLPDIRLQGCDAQYMVWTTHSPGRILKFFHSPLSLPPLGYRSQSTHCSSSTWLCMYLLYSLDCMSLSASLQFIFSENCSSCKCMFDTFMHSNDLHFLLLTSWYPSPIFTITVDDLSDTIWSSLCVYILYPLCVDECFSNYEGWRTSSLFESVDINRQLTLHTIHHTRQGTLKPTSNQCSNTKQETMSLNVTVIANCHKSF